MRWTFAICAALVGCTDNTSVPAAPDSPAAVDAGTTAVLGGTPPDSGGLELPAWLLAPSPLIPRSAGRFPASRADMPQIAPEQISALVKWDVAQTCFQNFDAGMSAIAIDIDGETTSATWDRNDPVIAACVDAAIRRRWWRVMTDMKPLHVRITFP